VTRTVIRYQTKPEATQHNTELIENVFRELEAAAPDGVRYLALRTADGTFIHFFAYEHEGDDDAITGLPAFAAFVAGGAERRTGPPDRADVTVIGDYRMLAR
jgi:hypothetical protein